MEKNKKNKIIGLLLGILIVLIIVVSSTYAYWQITKTQENPNDIVAACLSLNLENATDENPRINLENQWPISDEEGKNLTGYTFTVTNNCDQEVNYIVGLNSVEVSDTTNYMSYDSLKVQLDDNTPQIYGDLSDIEYADSENEYVARASKQLSVETLTNNGVNTHTIKIWIDENASIDDAGKSFSGQVFITGGQGIELPALNECFAVNDSGTITGYNYECGTEVVVPAEINGIKVKTINSASFALSNMQLYALYNETTEDEKYIYYISDENIVSDVTEYLKNNMCDDPETCTIADMEAMGLILLTSEEEYNAFDWEEYETSGYVVDGPHPAYFDVESGEEGEALSQITSLDLSEAVYLETIDTESFKNNENLATLILPTDGALTTIEESAFENSSITSLSVPSSVTTIGTSAFRYSNDGKGSLATLTFEDSESKPSQLIELGQGAFRNNVIANLILPDSLTIIGSESFQDNQIATLELPNKLEKIGGWAFCHNKLTELVTPSTLKNIGGYAFWDNNLTSIKLNEGLLYISDNGGFNAFTKNNLTKVVIPSTVIHIGHYSFSSNPDLTEIIIKRTEEDVTANMTFGVGWNTVADGVTATVTYNPNYTE